MNSSDRTFQLDGFITGIPQCLSGFQILKNSPLLEKIGHSSGTGVQLTCPCGADQFTLIGFKEAGVPDNIFRAPWSLQCAECGVVIPLFDEWKHGYDALIDGGLGESRHDEGFVEVREEGFRRVAVCFDYAIDCEVLDSLGITPEEAGDYFDWIYLYAAREDGEPKLVSDYECA